MANCSRGRRGSGRRYFLALWRDVLSAYPPALDADDWFQGAAMSVEDLAPYFAELAAARGEPAIRHLLDFVEGAIAQLTSNRTGWAFIAAALDYPDTPKLRALKWAMSDERVEQLRSLFFATQDPELAERVSWVEQELAGVIERWRVVRGGPA